MSVGKYNFDRCHNVSFYPRKESILVARFLVLQIFGAVQQEIRVSKAVEVMLTHVENLKRMFEKEHAELEETK